MTLSVIVGRTGAVLVLVGLVGGGFSFSGTVMPTVGKTARVPCFVVGGVLIFLAMGLSAYESELVPLDDAQQDNRGGGQSPLPEPPAPEPTFVPDPRQPVSVFVAGYYVLFYPTYVYADIHTGSDIVGYLEAGETVEIQCTDIGEWLSNPDGMESDLWDFIGYGYVPDVVVDTGTSQAVAPLCQRA